MSVTAGKVYLVGAGPGDPGLLTIRGQECLSAADVVLYDFLANPVLLELAPAPAERILVGKRHGVTTMVQDEIEALVVAKARAGLVVVRLKGGDPFVFGRGGEEAEACRRAGVEFEVVPGVTSATAVPAYAGIPLTHREHSSSVTFITGRPGPDRDLDSYDWNALAGMGGTLVFLMATLALDDIAGRLLSAGMPPSTPVAMVRWGTLPGQQRLGATLADISGRAEAQGMRPPVVVVVGEVAGLADELSWYEKLPLFGRRVVVTRARHQAQAMTAALSSLGADVIRYPTIETGPPSDPSLLEAALSRLSDFDWLVLSSSNAAACFFDAIKAAGRDIRELAGLRIAAIGPATEEVIGGYGLCVDARPSEFRGEALAQALGEVVGKRILVARAEVARQVLPEALEAGGAQVEVVPLYRTCIPVEPADDGPLAEADMFTFTSASTVDNFFELLGERAVGLLTRAGVAAIGPVTAGRLTARGVSPDLVPVEYTTAALVEAIARHFATRPVVS
ncbi:MAG: uroporphyrinogen-III C-methyltransferase [Deltaproteobacteria bacterium]